MVTENIIQEDGYTYQRLQYQLRTEWRCERKSDPGLWHLHRVGGPALIWNDSDAFFYIWGIIYPFEEWIEEIGKIVDKSHAMKMKLKWFGQIDTNFDWTTNNRMLLRKNAANVALRKRNKPKI